MPAEGVRIQKVLSQAGIASRRHAEDMIREGRVRVDGRIAQLGDRVQPNQVILLDGSRVHTDSTKRYVALNKPSGIVTTSRDPRGRKTVIDLVAVPERVYPVGRLDAATEGLLLLTNDGELAHRLAHPSFEVPKVYVAEIDGAITPASVRKLEKGVVIDGGTARADRVRIMATRRSHPATSLLEITLHEGRKHIVRKMLAAVGHPVQRLVRTEVGPIKLGRLAAGGYRNLTRPEVEALYELVGL